MSGLANLAFYTSVGCGMQSGAKKFGYNLTIQAPPKWDVTLQLPILQAAIAAHPAAIVVTPNDPIALQPTLKQATTEGIKIIVLDTQLQDPSVAASTITSNQASIGQAGFAALKAAKPNGGDVLVISNGPAVQPERDGGFIAAVKADPKFHLVSRLFDAGDVTKATQNTEAALAKDPNIVGIWTGGEIEGSGIIVAVKQAGLQSKIAVIEGDSDTGQAQSLAKGEIEALVAQQVLLLGTDAMDQVHLALTGGQPQATVLVPSAVLNRSNLNTPAGQGLIYKNSCT